MPLRIVIVAILFILGGLWSAVDVITKLLDNQISFNFGVFMIFVGRGLFKGKLSSRGWAVFWIALGYAAIGIFLITILVNPDGIEYRWNGELIDSEEGMPYALMAIALTMPVLIWMHWALFSGPARPFFSPDPRPDPRPD